MWFGLFFSYLGGVGHGGRRPLSGLLLCSPGSLSWDTYLLSGLPEEPTSAPVSCLALSFVESRTACSLDKQIPRCEPIRGCHVFRDGIPDLVCCVFFKTRPLPPKTSAGEGKHFSLNYCFLKWCQIMPHFHGPDTPLFPLTAFAEKAARWQSVDRVEASPGMLQMGKPRL